MNRSVSAQPLDWRRVGAMSSTFSLHVLTIAAALLVITAPRTPAELLRPQPAPLLVDLRDPAPIQAPSPPVEQPPPPVAVQPRRQPAPAVQASPLVEPVVPVSAVVTRTPAVAEEAPPFVPAMPTAGNQGAVAYADVRAPDYPPIARSRGLEGEALLRVLVAADGRAAQVRIEHSSGHSILDRAAVQAVRGWRFHPARVDGVAREAWIIVPINFRMDRG